MSSFVTSDVDTQVASPKAKHNVNVEAGTENMQNLSRSGTPAPAIMKLFQQLRPLSSEQSRNEITAGEDDLPRIDLFNDSSSQAEESDDQSTSSGPDFEASLVEDSHNKKTDEEQVAREAAESEALVWQLMQEEQESAYRIQMEFMSQMGGDLSEEDRLAMETIMREGIETVTEQHAEGEHEEDSDDDCDDEDGEESGGLDVDNMDYEQLLELGAAIGDVKKERWRSRSAAIIRDLCTITWDTVDESERKRLRLEDKCPVCMEEFAPQDALKILPCLHGFHAVCADGWLEENDSCPLCKQCILSTTTK
jgi:hypothetical protein